MEGSQLNRRTVDCSSPVATNIRQPAVTIHCNAFPLSLSLSFIPSIPLVLSSIPSIPLSFFPSVPLVLPQQFSFSSSLLPFYDYPTLPCSFIASSQTLSCFFLLHVSSPRKTTSPPNNFRFGPSAFLEVLF